MLDDVTSDDFVPSDDGVVRALMFGSDPRVASSDDVVLSIALAPMVWHFSSDSVLSKYTCK